MKKNIKNAARKAIGLGAISGLRTTIAPAVFSHFRNKKHKKALEKSKLDFIQEPLAATLTKWLSAAEVTADKMPGTPNRIKISQTLPRIASGALMGAVVFRSYKEDILQGIILGGASALATTFAGFYLRKYLNKLPYLKDPVLGTLEDAFAVQAAKRIVKVE